ALSKQLSTLEEAGYLSTERRLTGRRRTVRARLTAAGRSAYTGHIAALRAIIGDTT
ncbi:transcriptional regulator, partial [Streptomyces sp. SID10244]|nr:transcriptional regulator [Streptomyces sp. SID10244]